MPRVTIFLRLAPTSRGHRVVATTRPSSEPIRDQHGDALPTLSFAVKFDLPHDAFGIPILPDAISVPMDALTPVVEEIEVQA